MGVEKIDDVVARAQQKPTDLLISGN